MVRTRSMSRRGGTPLATGLTSRRPSYKPQDHCRRHRLPDRKEKTELITTYMRRKPKKRRACATC